VTALLTGNLLLGRAAERIAVCGSGALLDDLLPLGGVQLHGALRADGAAAQVQRAGSDGVRCSDGDGEGVQGGRAPSAGVPSPPM
jgi:hypothetical protein